MNKTIKRALLCLVLFGSAVVLTACDDFFASIFSDVETIEIDHDSLQAVYDIDTFRVSTVKLVVTRVDGGQQTIALTRQMLSQLDWEKLNFEGSHTLTVRYRGATTTFTIVLAKQASV